MIVKWGILGTARIAKRIIKAIQASPNGELFAISSRTRNRAVEFSHQNNINFSKVYDNYNDLLNDKDINAIYIPLPNYLHYEWVLKTASKKKHILCEKPFALNREQADIMFKECESHNVLVMEGFMYRFNPVVTRIKDLIKKNVIGTIKYIDFNFSHNIKNYLGEENNYRYHKELGGGSLFDLGIYGVNFFNFLFDNISSEIICAHSENFRDNTYDADISFNGLLKYQNDVICNLNCSFNYFGNYLNISGTKGQITLNNLTSQNEKKILIRNSDNDIILNENIPAFDHFKEEITHFNDCIISGKNPSITKNDTIQTIAIIQQFLNHSA